MVRYGLQKVSHSNPRPLKNCHGSVNADSLFSRCLDLSQSCVREHDRQPWGIVGCITPSANPYLTHRGGPLLGAEALALQGIPRGRLILNRESSKQLVDLSGNAMTTTTVGACILAALISCSKIFSQRSTRPIKPMKSLTAPLESAPSFQYDPNWLLTKTDLTTGLRLPITIAEIRVLAFRSIRLCFCESPGQIFQQCSSCGHTSCGNCGSKPAHKYGPRLPQALMKRASGENLDGILRKALPPRLVIDGLLRAHLAAASVSHSQLGSEYTQAVKGADVEVCQLVSIKLDRDWRVVYESEHSRLVLTCQPKWEGRVLSSENLDDQASAVVVQWKFYAKPDRGLLANSQIREELLHPIARLTCSESLFDGQWEIRTAVEKRFNLEVVGDGHKVDSWEKKQGLDDPLFNNRLVWSTLDIRVPPDSGQSMLNIPNGILGKYFLLSECDSASGSLHVKHKSSEACREEPVFLFLDPAPLCNASFDSFVFANQHHRLGLNDVREVLAKVDAGWRPPGAEKASRMACVVPSQWTTASDVQLREFAPSDLQNVYLASAETPMGITSTQCESSGLPVIWCQFQMEKKIAQKLDLKARKCFHLVRDQFSLAPLSWLLRTAGNALQFNKWQSLRPEDSVLDPPCAICAPKPPKMVWKAVRAKGGNQIRPFENVKEACDYERTVKVAPEVVTAELSYDDSSGLAALRVDFNVLTLVHKAVAALIESHGSSLVPSTMEWQAVVDTSHDCQVPFPQLQLRDCQHNTPASQPPSFGKLIPDSNERRPLLKEAQLKSLAWMISREEDKDHSWYEQEIVEAIVAPMNLRLEARVTARCNIKGGVLADDVGYGKTPLVIALIDHYFQKMKPARSPKFVRGTDDTISLKATLILVPSNLIEQWLGQIEKFVGGKGTYEILKLTKEDFIEKSRVSEFQKADIILAAWDLLDDDYFKQLARMSRAPHTPVSGGRGFKEWLQMAQKDLRTLVKKSHGLQLDHLSSAWHDLDTNKYERFLELSKRNKKGSRTSTDASGKCASKKVRTDVLEVEDIEIEAPTEPFLPFHACIFERLVIDEFTYVGAKQLPAILALRAPRRWILSGTPPYNTFPGMSLMANLVGTTIGVPDDAALRNEKVKDSTTSDISGMLAPLSTTATGRKLNFS
jgi:SNF2-related domain